MNIEQLAKEYESTVKHIIYSAEQPTEDSIQTIEAKLGIKLPNSFIEFARSSKNYGNWFVSIGPDYSSESHILTINSALVNEGKLPKNFVAINVGYDEDYSCIDVETYDTETDEYLITYWASDVSQRKSALSEGFPQYIKQLIEYWRNNA